MRFKLEIPWPYDEAETEAVRLLAAGGGTIRDHDVLDAVLDRLPKDAEATFVAPTVWGLKRELSEAAVRDFRETLGHGFWLPGSIPE